MCFNIFEAFSSSLGLDLVKTLLLLLSRYHNWIRHTHNTVCEVTYHIKYGWNLIFRAFRHLAVHNNVVAVQTEANKKWLHLLYHSFSQDAPPLSINTSTVICFTMCALVCVVCLVSFPYPAQLSVTSGMVKVGEGLHGIFSHAVAEWLSGIRMVLRPHMNN